MKREYFIMHLEAHCCEMKRHAKGPGYSVFRNTINNKISGVPKNDPLSEVMISRICMSLGIPIPAIIGIRHQKAIGKISSHIKGIKRKMAESEQEEE